MGSWNHYIVTDHQTVSLEDAERALQAADPDFYIDADVVVLRNAYGEAATEELECGQISVECFSDPLLLPDRAFFEERFAGKQNQERLRAVLDGARTLVSVQLLNIEFWWDNEPSRTLRPLQDWLIENLDGVLWVESGEIFDRQGAIL